MRVLHLTSHLNAGGITVYIHQLIEPLRENDVEIFVAAAGGDYESQFRQKHIPLHLFPFRTKNELDPRLYKAIPALEKWMREQSIDLIHAHTRVMQVMAYWIQKRTGIPYVTTSHGFFERRLGRRLLPAWGNRVVAISSSVGEVLLRDHHVESSRIQVIYNAVDQKKLRQSFLAQDGVQAKKSFGFSSDDYVAGVVSRLVWDKGHHFLIQALSKLRQQNEKVKLLIVGDGRNRVPLEHLVQQLHLKEHVHFAGTLTDISQALAAMDLFVFPAIWREGFGLSIVEAMSCGIPIICSDIGAINELVENEKTGLLVAPKNPDSLAEAILKMKNQPEFGSSLAQAAQTMVEERFTLVRMAREISHLYREVLGTT